MINEKSLGCAFDKWDCWVLVIIFIHFYLNYCFFSFHYIRLKGNMRQGYLLGFLQCPLEFWVLIFNVVLYQILITKGNDLQLSFHFQDIWICQRIGLKTTIQYSLKIVLHHYNLFINLFIKFNGYTLKSCLKDM